MKVDSTKQPAVAAAPRFRDAVGQQRPSAAARSGMPTERALPAVTAERVAAAAAKSTADAAEVVRAGRARVEGEAGRLTAARAGHVARAEGLVTTRAEAVTGHGPEQQAGRALEAIIQELVQAFEGVPARAANDGPGGTAPAIPHCSNPGAARAAHQSAAEFEQENQARAEQAFALIERIELFVKSAQRPALALTLNNSLGARVEIERVGPREVALKLVGQHGPPAPDAVSRIRDELVARGLKVAALSVA
jgi:hypothetical protein